MCVKLVSELNWLKNSLFVAAETSPPNILYPNAALTLYRQTKFTVECHAAGVPQPSYQWKLGDKVVGTPGVSSFDSATGILTFTDFSPREEGDYRCYASNYVDLASGRRAVTSLSPPLTLLYIRILRPSSLPEYTLVGKEYDYIKIPCGSDQFTAVAETINYNWYTDAGNNQMGLDGGRLFIDRQGDLHITYLLSIDSKNATMKCGLSADLSPSINFGIKYHLQIASGNKVAVPPQLRYKSDDNKGLIYKNAKLECFFSGYDPAQLLPLITWTLDDGTVIHNNDKYVVSADGRSLTIYNLVESDERNYYCKAKNNVGETTPNAVFLNVTSPPIFYENKAPRDITVIQGKSAFIPCEARSASHELNPSPPIWYINGVQTGSHTDRAKYDLKIYSLEIKGMRKPDDIVCVQCLVKNSEGELMGEACVNVLLPITLTRQPLFQQEIDIGDTIDLTITATTDVSQQLNYKWTHYRNKSLVGGEVPKFSVNDPITKEAYINTSGMSETEYEAVRGIYVLNISHLYDFTIVEIQVTLKDKPVPEEPVTAEAGFDMWIIGLIVGILFLIIVIIIIIFVICRKQQEGDYNVDKKETRAGLDPEKELKDKGFNEFSRPTFDDYDYPDKKPKGDLEYDDVPIGGDDESLGEYGDEEDTHFNEDGSFIGIYDKKEPPRPPAQTNESTI